MGVGVKIVVPEAMVMAVYEEAIKDADGVVRYSPSAGVREIEMRCVRKYLEAGLLWLDGELEKMIQGNPYETDQYMRTESLNENSVRTGFNKAIGAVRRMFLAPEPEVPEEIRDLLLMSEIHTPSNLPDPMYARHDADVIEAYRRGQKSK